MSEDIIKCNKCAHVLISGKGCCALFGTGTSIQCRQCGSKYVFGQKEFPKQEKDKINFQV